MIRMLNRAISKYITVPRRERELERMNIKNLGYYLAGVQRARVPVPANLLPLNVRLLSKACTQLDIESAWLPYWCSELACAPLYHRKVWELCYIAQALYSAGKLTPGNEGLGFGCGEEPLPSLFAKHGVKVLATDLDPSDSGSAGWVESGQHSRSVEQIRMERICPDPVRRNTIDLRYVDMNAIPAEFEGRFDFCWSACSLEHLGSIAHGSEFIQKSLATLKPGGMAVHTTEWNMQDEGGTIDHAQTVLFQKKHLVAIADRARAAGFLVRDLDFTRSEEAFDGLTDLPPYGAYGKDVLHLRIALNGYRCTSFGLIIERPRAAS
jgi:2-polyprenyl-3-methyl-5-hydroxy-6-metoxy-1,4-benzoquinol methylase